MVGWDEERAFAVEKPNPGSFALARTQTKFRGPSLQSVVVLISTEEITVDALRALRDALFSMRQAEHFRAQVRVLSPYATSYGAT